MGVDEKYLLDPRHHAYIIFGDIPEGLRTSEGSGVYVIRSDRSISVEDARSVGEYALPFRRGHAAGAAQRAVNFGAGAERAAETA